MNIFSSIRGWFAGATAETVGTQRQEPSSILVSDTQSISIDGALQISTIWACIELRASTIASLPLFAYQVTQGQKELARNSRLYSILHDSPNSRMTPFEFWRAMVMNHDLRGNAYARIDRDAKGEAIALWPMPADQVETKVLDDGSMIYLYKFANDIAVFAAENVLHIKNLGNGTTGLSKLDFMRSTTDEATKAQSEAAKTFGNGGKPTGILMIDKVLNPQQRKAVLANFAEMALGHASRLYLLEADMKYDQLSMSPQDQQLLETRKFNVEELCRWYGVPPVLVHHSNVTAWGSGIYEIIDGFHKFSLRPLVISIEQAVRKRVMTSLQRVTMTAEFNLDALLRGSLKDRMEIYAKAAQNGLKTRNECRQLENDPPIAGGDQLTAQSNLVPLSMLGKVAASGGNGSNIAQ